MIRGFSLLCKINFNHFSVADLFFHYMNIINVHDYSCPKCGAKLPGWEDHGTYKRDLISFEKNGVVYNTVRPARSKCASCDSTHATLPEFIIPFKSHCLFFILAVMKDYFLSPLTVNQICSKYEIAVSTLYRWKAAFLRDKRIWLGALEDVLTSVSEFLAFLAEKGLHRLDMFFATTNYSFLQNQTGYPRNGRFTPD